MDLARRVMGLARRALMTIDKIIHLMFFARRALTLNANDDNQTCWLIPYGKKKLDMSYSIVIYLLTEK